jgi:hypothetical protein
MTKCNMAKISMKSIGNKFELYSMEKHEPEFAI